MGFSPVERSIPQGFMAESHPPAGAVESNPHAVEVESAHLRMLSALDRLNAETDGSPSSSSRPALDLGGGSLPATDGRACEEEEDNNNNNNNKNNNPEQEQILSDILYDDIANHNHQHEPPETSEPPPPPQQPQPQQREDFAAAEWVLLHLLRFLRVHLPLLSP